MSDIHIQLSGSGDNADAVLTPTREKMRADTNASQDARELGEAVEKYVEGVVRSHDGPIGFDVKVDVTFHKAPKPTQNIDAQTVKGSVTMPKSEGTPQPVGQGGPGRPGGPPAPSGTVTGSSPAGTTPSVR